MTVCHTVVLGVNNIISFQVSGFFFLKIMLSVTSENLKIPCHTKSNFTYHDQSDLLIVTPN